MLRRILALQPEHLVSKRFDEEDKVGMERWDTIQRGVYMIDL